MRWIEPVKPQRLGRVLFSGVILATVCAPMAWASPAERIDALLAASRERAGIVETELPPRIDDATFLRRAFLQWGGRIPTVAEAEAFLADERPEKRPELIKALLHSEAYVAHTFHFWADLLRLNGGLDGPAHDAYALWIKQALRENLPYDQFVAQLVSARGHFWDSGAVGYYFLDRGMPLDNMANTVRVFLGTRLECAQCHDHPFDDWTQMDFYEMAAYTYPLGNLGDLTPNRDLLRTRLRQIESQAYHQAIGIPDFPKINVSRFEGALKYGWVQAWLRKTGMEVEEFRRLATVGQQAFQQTLAVNSITRNSIVRLYSPLKYVAVHETPGAKLQLPHDYIYTDAKPFDVVRPKTMFGEDAPADGDAYAAWMTGPENPRFTTVIVNRLWKRAFGRGLIEPVDELMEKSVASHPELLGFLEDLMRELAYDQKAFLQILTATDAWQREAIAVSNGEPYHFEAPLLRRMTAEQIWDSLVALTTPNPDQYRPRILEQLAGIERNRRIHASLEGRTAEQFLAVVDQMTELVGNAPKTENQLRQALSQAKLDGDEARMAELSRQIAELRRGVKQRIEGVIFSELQGEIDARHLLATSPLAEVTVVELPEPAPLVRPELESEAAKRWDSRERLGRKDFAERIRPHLIRASELRSPAPRGHFLRDFGQSDRSVIDNSHQAATVPQALNLMNGSNIDLITCYHGVLGRQLAVTTEPEEIARLVMLAMLSREPTDAERATIAEEVERTEDGTAAVLWALLNSQKFLFVP